MTRLLMWVGRRVQSKIIRCCTGVRSPRLDRLTHLLSELRSSLLHNQYTFGKSVKQSNMNVPIILQSFRKFLPRVFCGGSKFWKRKQFEKFWILLKTLVRLSISPRWTVNINSRSLVPTIWLKTTGNVIGNAVKLCHGYTNSSNALELHPTWKQAKYSRID